MTAENVVRGMKKDYYPKPRAVKEVDANLLGPCGFYCGSCLAYKNGVCLGCRYQAESRETAGAVKVFCEILACATEKGLEACAECSAHPCPRYSPDRSIFSDVFLSYLKNEAKKGHKT